MMTKYDHDKISHQKLGLNWDWISTQAKTIPFMHDTETKQSSLNSIPILVLGNLATFFLYSWKRVTYDHDHDPHLTHNVCWVFSIRHLEERQWRQNIKREMLLQTWLWSVEMGANIAENGGRKNISKDITGEGRRVFATLTCWVGTGGEEIWSCELNSGQLAVFTQQWESHKAVSSSRQFNLCLQICQLLEGRRLWRHIKQGLLVYDKPLKLVYLHRSARSFHLSTIVFTSISALATGIIQTAKTKQRAIASGMMNISLFCPGFALNNPQTKAFAPIFFTTMQPWQQVIWGEGGGDIAPACYCHSTPQVDIILSTILYYAGWPFFAGILSHWIWYSSMKMIIVVFHEILEGAYLQQRQITPASNKNTAKGWNISDSVTSMLSHCLIKLKPKTMPTSAPIIDMIGC